MALIAVIFVIKKLGITTIKIQANKAPTFKYIMSVKLNSIGT
jgi:hypothetical protein